MHIDDGFDIVVLLFVCIVGFVSTMSCYGQIARTIEPYMLTDKTVITEDYNDAPEPYEWCVRDFLLMFMVADEYCPDPKTIDLQFPGSTQDTTMTFNEDFLTKMEGHLQKYYINHIKGNIDRVVGSYDYYYADGVTGRWRYYVE